MDELRYGISTVQNQMGPNRSKRQESERDQVQSDSTASHGVSIAIGGVDGNRVAHCEGRDGCEDKR